jgi:heterodisulfide reductase subunit A
MSEEIRVGVFVCDCGMNIAGSVDCGAVVEYAKTLPNVACVLRNTYTCSDPGQNEIKAAIREHRLNRAVVATYLMEMANLREQCSWVHLDDREGATAKAKDLVASAVARASLLQAQEERSVPVTDAILVIGGGVTGIEAALQLGDAGHKVVLVEKAPSIGGIMAQLDKTFPTMDCSI